MEYLTRTELKRLSALCEHRIFDDAEIIASPNTSTIEKALAEHDKTWMRSIQIKLDRIEQSKAKRIEITL